MTVFSEHGSLDNLDKISRKLDLSEVDELRWRIQLAIDYLKFLDFIHIPRSELALCAMGRLYQNLCPNSSFRTIYD